jgi:protein-arginine kinase activator protein McsA
MSNIGAKRWGVCKVCPEGSRVPLKQTGDDGRNRGWVCTECGTVHDNQGEVYDWKKTRGSDVMSQCCPFCGSSKIVRYPYQGEAKCQICGKKWSL